MKKRSSYNSKLTRRELLKTAGVGICYLGVLGITGCAPNDKEEKKIDEMEKKGIQQEEQISADYRKGLINPKLSPWFSELDNNRVKCELCPEQCMLEQGERAKCRVRENREGKGYTLAYGNPALLQEDPIERKPFFHVLPGSRALSVSTAGCNLKCKFCEVWDMALEDPEEVYAYDVPPEKVLKYAREGNLTSISYAFGEPVICYEYMFETASEAKRAGYLNLVHTAGYINKEPLENLIDKIDAVNVDLKGFDEEFYREMVGGELEPVLNTLKILKDAGMHIEITNIVIPNLNDNIGDIKEMCEWITSVLGEDVPVHFSRFYPLYKLSELPRTPVSTLEEARNTAKEAGLNFVYIAKVAGHEGENTFCPGCGEVIIKRMGFVIESINMDGDKCQYCGTVIPGRWE